LEAFFPEHETEYVGPKKDSMKVRRNSEFGNSVSNAFESLRSGIDFAPAEIDSITLKESSERVPERWPFYTADTTDGYFFLGVAEDSVSQSLKEELTALIAEELQEFGRVTQEDILGMKCTFHDMAHCELSSVLISLQTTNPENYYDIESLEEYICTLADNPEEEQSLREKDAYTLRLKLDTLLGDTPEEITTAAEEGMEEFIESTLETGYETMVEAEVLEFGDFEKLNYSMDTEDISKYYVYVPVLGDQIGVSGDV
jgi:hypothetical protein